MASIAAVGPKMLDELADVFAAFAGGCEMDGRAFLKCVRDADLLDSKLTLIDVDLIFAACKPKGGRKINLPRFGRALGMVAARKQMSAAAILAAVCVAKAPIYDSGITLPASCDAEIRKVLSNGGYPQTYSEAPTGCTSATATPPQPPPSAFSQALASALSVPSLPLPAQGYAPSAATAAPAAMARSASSGERGLPVLLGSALLSARRAAQDYDDDYYGKQKMKTTRSRNPLPVFESRHQAGHRRRRGSQSPPAAGQRGPERLYYDKSTYTGTHKYGGPSTAGSAVGNGGYSDLSTLVKRERVQDDGLQRRKSLRGVDDGTEGPMASGFESQLRSTSIVVDAMADEMEPQGRITYNVPSPRRVGPERFYYDKSTYTGTHKNGGPQSHGSGVGKDGYSDLSALVHRSRVQEDDLMRRKFSASSSQSGSRRGLVGGSSLSLNALLSPRLQGPKRVCATQSAY